MAVEQPLGLTMEIMRLRSFARMWKEAKRPRGEDEEPLRGPMVDWVNRIVVMRDEASLARVLGDDAALANALAPRRG